MDKHSIASLGCKFLGIYTLLESIPLMGNIAQMYAFAYADQESGVFLILSTSIPFVAMVLSAIVFIVFSDKVATKMVGSEIEENPGANLTSKEFQSIAFSIVGLCLLVLSLPKIVQIGWNISTVKSVGDERLIFDILRKTWSYAVAAGVQLVLGFFLFIGADLISTLWHVAKQRLTYEKNKSNE